MNTKHDEPQQELTQHAAIQNVHHYSRQQYRCKGASSASDRTVGFADLPFTNQSISSSSIAMRLTIGSRCIACGSDAISLLSRSAPARVGRKVGSAEGVHISEEQLLSKTSHFLAGVPSLGNRLGGDCFWYGGLLCNARGRCAGQKWV